MNKSINGKETSYYSGKFCIINIFQLVKRYLLNIHYMPVSVLGAMDT